jgi:hypothetical protein
VETVQGGLRSELYCRCVMLRSFTLLASPRCIDQINDVNWQCGPDQPECDSSFIHVFRYLNCTTASMCSHLGHSKRPKIVSGLLVEFNPSEIHLRSALWAIWTRVNWRVFKRVF